MKIGIISDTHTKVKKAKRAIDTLIKDGANFIIHAGDIVEVEILEYLEGTGIRYVAVYGNNDAHLAEHHAKFNLVQEPYYFKLSGTTFKLMHLPFYMLGDTDVVIFGHTHKAYVDFVDNTLFLNSGEICARNKALSEWSMLELKSEHYLVTNYTRANKSEEIKKEEIEYMRTSRE